MGRPTQGVQGDEPARRRHVSAVALVVETEAVGRDFATAAEDGGEPDSSERSESAVDGVESTEPSGNGAAGRERSPSASPVDRLSRCTVSRYCCHAGGTTGAATRMKIVGPGGARLVARVHLDLRRRAVALPAVARRAGGDDVLPGARAAAAARDHVVDRQMRGPAAVLAGPRVAREDRPPRDPAACGCRAGTRT